jgi:hypothetical protein
MAVSNQPEVRKAAAQALGLDPGVSIEDRPVDTGLEVSDLAAVAGPRDRGGPRTSLRTRDRCASSATREQ